MSKIRIGIVGYGNIGRGVEQAIKRNEDMELAAVFTRRDPASVKVATEGAKVVHMDDMLSMKGDVDVMVLCGGSATDLPVMGPEIAANFNTIDSFDTHAKIPEYFANVDKAAKEGNNISIISVGWDPGMFSLNRLYAESILVQGSTYTFWGKGVSQGHSMDVRVVSFGFKYGLPLEADLVFDVRFLPNPYYIPELKHQTGLDEPVRSFVFKYQQTLDFTAKVEDLLSFLLPNYLDEGKTDLVIAVGCTGGKHRSVCIAKELYEFVSKKGYAATLSHRDMGRR